MTVIENKIISTKKKNYLNQLVVRFLQVEMTMITMKNNKIRNLKTRMKPIKMKTAMRKMDPAVVTITDGVLVGSMEMVMVQVMEKGMMNHSTIPTI